MTSYCLVNDVVSINIFNSNTEGYFVKFKSSELIMGRKAVAIKYQLVFFCDLLKQILQ